MNDPEISFSVKEIRIESAKNGYRVVKENKLLVYMIVLKVVQIHGIELWDCVKSIEGNY